MKKINKNNFYKLFIQNKDILDDNECISRLTHEDIIEFKIGNKYFYKLNSSPSINLTHKNLCNDFLNTIPINNSSTAYRPGVSYLNLFEPHRDGYYFLRLDISSFFHSIKESLLKDSFFCYFENEYIDEKEKQLLLDGFISLITYEVPENSPNQHFRKKIILPIGFKTSPAVSNIIFRKLDILIQKYCTSKKIIYTRYADDMLFSSSKLSKFIHSEAFFKEIEVLLSIDGFKINKRKTIKSEHTISLNGYTLTTGDATDHAACLRISNKKTKIIEKMLHKIKNEENSEQILTKLFSFKNSPKYFTYYPPKKEFLEKYCNDQLMNKVTGYRSFLISIIKFNEKYQCLDNVALIKYTKLINALNNYIQIKDNRSAP